MPRKAKEKTEELKKTEKLSQADFEKKVIELAKKGLTAEKVGESLRREGIHPKEFNKKISKILGKDYVNPDLKNISDKLEKIKSHFEKNKGDKRAMREKDRIFAKLRRTKKFFSE